MNRANAYTVLAAELETYRELPGDALAALVGVTQCKVVPIDEGDCSVEVQVQWVTPKQSSVRVTAIAYGPSHLMTERYEEALTLPVRETDHR